MSLERLEVKNFKRFKSLQMPLNSAITVILGENSSGKSSIIKAILGIKQTTASSNEHEGWAAHGDYVDLGTFQDYIYKKNVSLPFTISITVSRTAVPTASIYRRLLGKSSSLTVDFTYDHDPTTSQSRFLSVKAIYGAKEDAVSWELKRQKTRRNYVVNVSSEFIKRYNATNLPQVFHLDPKDKLVVSHIERMVFQKSSISRKMAHVQLVSIINGTISVVSGYIEKHLFYLAPLRSSPSRSYIRSSHNLATGVSGEHTPSVLANLEKRAKKVTGGESKHLRDLNFFHESLAEVFPGHSAATRTFDELVKIKIASRETGDYAISDRSDAITDVGFGFSQVFPILVQIAVMPEGATLVVEQPELHLHPMAQTRLARVFAKAASVGKRFIVETHSEHFVRGIQLAVSESRSVRPGLTKEDVTFMYVKKSTSEPFVQLALNDFGEFTSDWPSGFFDESYKNIKTLVANRLRGP